MLNTKLLSLHNKTQIVADEELPYNSKNNLINEEDIIILFNKHGLKDVKPNNINLYRNAFVHKSYCTMKNADFVSGNQRCPSDCLPLQEMSYERLELLGDSILEVCVTKYLFDRYPDQNEGFISRLRTKLVNGKMLGHLSGLIGFSKFAIISKQIEQSQGRDNYKILEDIFEAFIGAIMMDFQNDEDNVEFPSKIPKSIFPLSGVGIHIAEIWVINILETYIDFSDLIQSKNNYKDMLVRYMQHTFQDNPKFFEINVDMKNNKKVFLYCVKNHAGAVLGTANGDSKKDAENNAAKAALIYYGQSLE
jgi:ribonuclease-3